MGVTTNRGFPYPEPTDQRRLGADAIKALAQDLDTKFSDSGWITATLQSGFTNQGSGWPNAAYRKLNGVVYLRGMLINGSRGNGAPILDLPVGFRIGSVSTFSIAAGQTPPSGGPPRVYVWPSGSVQVDALGTGDWVSLIGTTFIAEQ